MRLTSREHLSVGQEARYNTRHTQSRYVLTHKMSPSQFMNEDMENLRSPPPKDTQGVAARVTVPVDNQIRCMQFGSGKS